MCWLVRRRQPRWSLFGHWTLVWVAGWLYSRLKYHTSVAVSNISNMHTRLKVLDDISKLCTVSQFLCKDNFVHDCYNAGRILFYHLCEGSLLWRGENIALCVVRIFLLIDFANFVVSLSQIIPSLSSNPSDSFGFTECYRHTHSKPVERDITIVCEPGPVWGRYVSIHMVESGQLALCDVQVKQHQGNNKLWFVRWSLIYRLMLLICKLSLI